MFFDSLLILFLSFYLSPVLVDEPLKEPKIEIDHRKAYIKYLMILIAYLQGCYEWYSRLTIIQYKL